MTGRRGLWPTTRPPRHCIPTRLWRRIRQQWPMIVTARLANAVARHHDLYHLIINLRSGNFFGSFGKIISVLMGAALLFSLCQGCGCILICSANGRF